MLLNLERDETNIRQYNIIHLKMFSFEYRLTYSPPPSGDLASLKEVAVTPAEATGGCSAPANTVRFADLSFKRSYSYGVLEKKWSL